MNEVARLANPDALGRAALTGEPVEVIVKVPVESFAAAYKLLRPILDDGAPHLEAWLTEEGRSEDELRLLCALLCTVEDNLPTDTAHLLAWQEKVGEPQYLDDFAVRRFKQVKPDRILNGLNEAALIDALELVQARKAG